MIVSTAELAAWLSSFDHGWDDGCNPFSDDDGNVFEPAIEWLAATGITKWSKLWKERTIPLASDPRNGVRVSADQVSRRQLGAAPPDTYVV